MTQTGPWQSARRVLYHHRTQGKAVEGVHIRGIADALKAGGVAVDVLSLPGADPYATPKAMSPTQQATSLMRLVSKLPEPLFECVELAYNAIVAWRILAYLRRNRDVDFIYERYSLFMFAGLLVARIKGLPFFLEVNDSSEVVRVRPLFFRRLASMIERWVFRKSTGLVFVSRVFQQRMEKAHGKIAPAIVTPNAANIDKFSFTQNQRQSARERLGLDGSVVCGYLGAFVPWHAIDRFVYAIADRLPEAPHLKLLLVGDGATFDDVKRFVQERGLSSQVILAGRVAHDEVPGLLAAMDMAILPGAGDYTSPVKLFEFMASGVAPVAPDFDPIQEVLVNDKTGWVFKAGDMDAAVEAVVRRSGDPGKLHDVGMAAREYIRAERQWCHNVEQLLNFHLSLGGGRAAHS
jgi:glycosyltransferase involved in cell wall biosynthesis